MNETKNNDKIIDKSKQEAMEVIGRWNMECDSYYHK